MSFPYERLLGTSARPSSRPSSSGLARPPTGSDTTTPSGTSTASASSTATANATSSAASAAPGAGTAPGSSAKKLVSVRRSKPTLPFFVRPRYRFDLPDPPMDPKMLLGCISTATYASPQFNDIERDHRPAAVPSDPTHALRINLVTPASDSVPSPPPTPNNSSHQQAASQTTANTQNRHRLSIDDSALLQSIMTSRPGAAGKQGLDGQHRRAGVTPLSGGAGGLSSSLPRGSGGSVMPHAQPAANAVSNAPWMRRMSYDEYFAPSTARPTSRHIHAVSRKHGLSTTPLGKRDAATRRQDQQRQLSEHRRNQMLASFGASRKTPVHPDMRKGHLKPVKITPVLPNLASVLEDFIAVEFDPDELLTLEHRPKADPAAAAESVRSIASVSLTDGAPPTGARQEPKKFAACYTPTDETLERRKQRRNESAEDNAKEDGESGDLKRRKIHFVEDEQYEWFGEYSIREGKFGGVMSRSCFAIDEWRSDDEKRTVATFSRIRTSWKLARRPFREDTIRLGKEGLKLSREFVRGSASYSIDAEDDDMRRHLLAGRRLKNQNGAKKKEQTLMQSLG